MNAVLPVVVEKSVDTSQLGEITAAWQITPEALIVTGWRQEKCPTDGSVAHSAKGAPKGRFHSVSWPFPSAGDNAQHFAAALQLPIGSGAHPGETLLMIGKGDAAGVLARLPARFQDTQTFATDLARVAAANAVLVTQFLTRTFSPSATRSNADIRIFLYAFLERASSPDGCIEIIGAIDGHCVILQGWGSAPGPDCEVVVVGASVECHTPRLASFQRQDMRGNAGGQIVVLPQPAFQGLGQIEAIVLLDRRGLRWRPIVRERRLLSGPETIAHLRAALAGLECDAATRSMLQKSLRPRFEGRFTLYDTGHPVRLAVDLAAASRDAGTYLTGWLYDPRALVAEVLLCSTGDGSSRVSDNWTQIIRQDVTDAFLNDSALPRVETNQHQHGFAIHVSSVGPAAQGESVYLDVTFQDGKSGFVPLTICSADDQANQTRLLASVDLHKPSGVEVIEKHLAPFLLRVAVSCNKPKPLLESPVSREWTRPLVVPLADQVLPRAMLSQFLGDPLGRDEALMFVCGDNWTDSSVATLRALTTFYGYPFAILRVQGTVSPATALLAVASVLDHQRLLLLAPGTVGRSRGWRQAMHAALDAAGGMTCVSPTVVYEDESIRFGGTDQIEPLASAPYVRIRRRLAGMPVSIIGATEQQPTVTISPACCLVPRAVVDGLGAATGVAATASLQEITLSLMLQQNGATSIWTPTAQVYAADAPLMGVQENTARVRALVDGWCSRAYVSVKE